ncbi:hypothetical protein ACFS07_13540 [Undibacterium arcticum]
MRPLSLRLLRQKKISKAAAKGHQRHYAYYRCIGTDAYRFGGERVCDNQQIRTDRLDDLVWQQVIELLAHPGRLKSEYERRLSVLEKKKKKTSSDTASLERQRLQLEKGKSRLIDSYADGMLDKADFDPKMRQLKVRLEQIDHQIQESRRNNAGQSELFLVINRLEEFASAVHDRLDTIDFVMKREVILGLVKRVEIHKEEILVVFRVDPDPGFNADENSANSDVGEKKYARSYAASFLRCSAIFICTMFSMCGHIIGDGIKQLARSSWSALRTTVWQDLSTKRTRSISSQLWSAYSTPNWTPISRQTGHPFHGKLDSQSSANWTPIPLQTGQFEAV